MYPSNILTNWKASMLGHLPQKCCFNFKVDGVEEETMFHPARITGVFRTETGQKLLSFTGPMNLKKSNKEELLSIHQALFFRKANQEADLSSTQPVTQQSN
eukprot:TRINITY_DN1150_c0_g2_i1.p1 TRINITY_DN1150_c0_g2~~TRINITY_DN1150_c0_g2_i1.p1  ORF type:complete len:101 (+),score=17.98 TRINITY_DN1150_c0_g2_i1:1623-1925(+)